MREFGKRNRAGNDAPRKTSFFGRVSFSAKSDNGNMARQEQYKSAAPDTSRRLGADNIMLAHEQIMEENRALHQGLADLKDEIVSMKAAPHVNATAPSSVAGSVNDEVHSLLAELRGDIVALKDEQQSTSIKADNEVHKMLAELKGDILALKEEQPAPAGAPSSIEASEVRSLLAELKGDIATLKDEQVKTTSMAESSKADEVHSLLQELKGDIVNLKEEQVRTRAQLPAAFSNSSSTRINDLLSQLKGEIDTARAEQGEVSPPMVDGTAEGQSEIDTLSTVNNVLTLLIGNNEEDEKDEVEETGKDGKAIAAD